MENYKIYVRDQNLNRIAEIDDFQSLTAIPKFNDVGTWQLVLNTTIARKKGLFQPFAGIVIERNGIEIISGPIINLSRQWDINGDVLTLSGVDDNCWLKRRLASPDPSSNGDYSTEAYDIQSGAAEAVMKRYVDYNGGPSALSQRQVPGLTLAPDQGQGSTITQSARFDDLLTLLQTIALAGGDLGFRVVQVDNALQFQVYTPENKTATIIFSPALGNLRAFTYSETAPSANYVIVGGQGQGTARTFVERGDSASIAKWGRIEDFEDRRDTSDATQMQQTITDTLSQDAEQNSLSITPVDTKAMTFGQDYSLGDKVSVVIVGEDDKVDIQRVVSFLQAPQTVESSIEHVRKIYPTIEVIQDVVRSVNISLTPNNAEVITPTVGTPKTLAANVPKIFKDMTDLTSRVSKLERRQ